MYPILWMRKVEAQPPSIKYHNVGQVVEATDSLNGFPNMLHSKLKGTRSVLTLVLQKNT